MPRICWNAQVKSVRPLVDLVSIKLLNYKSTMETPGNTGLIRMQLEFRPALAIPNPYHKTATEVGEYLEVKTYMVNKEGLSLFIETIQYELVQARHLQVKCLIS